MKIISIGILISLSTSLIAQHEHHTTSTQNPTPVVTNKYKTKPVASKPQKTHAKKKTLTDSKPIISAGVERTVNLVINYKLVNFAGKTRKAIAVNDQIPAPTLNFTEGDYVTLNVYNNLDKPTAIHWHGLLVPWQMDGVEGVNQQAIPPKGVFHYRFKLYQSGTYWYHAHADVQEQEGLYGAFIINPSNKSTPYKYTKDQVIVLSDWSNSPALNVLNNLKKDGDYYSPRFPLQPSLIKFLHDYRKADVEERKKLIDDYKMMQQMRMSIYDFSDIAYDAYLLNGQSKYCPWTAPVSVGDVVRLRFIGAAASTIYRVKIHGSKMEMIHIQGNDVKPYVVDDFYIAPGETYDALVRINNKKPYIIYAESIDTLGKTYGALVSGVNQPVNYQQVPPFPEPKPVTREMMANMKKSEMKHVSEHNNHSKHSAMQPGMSSADGKKADTNMPMAHSMNMPTEPTIIGDTISPPNTFQAITSGTKYQHLSAAIRTNDPNKPVDGIIRMELFGYMERFIWFINGLPDYKAKPIVLEPNKRYQIIFTNHSMMRHPMHLHGHWFILRNGHGAYDPLLHTISVPPGATAVADVDTDASGQWFFHCHHLYHMVTGMSRVVQYSTLIDIVQGTAEPQNYSTNTDYINRPIVREDAVIPIDPALVRHPMAHTKNIWLANFLDVGADPFNNVQELTFKGLYGSDYHKLELYTNEAEINKGKVENADIDIFYWHLLSQFWAAKAGVNYFYRPAKKPYWQAGVGIEGLMPFFIETNVRSYYYRGSVKLDMELSRDTQITNNGFVQFGLRAILATKTLPSAEIGNGLNQLRFIVRPYYRLMPGFNVFSEFEHLQNYGAFRIMQINEGESASENTLTFGLSFLL